MSPADRISVRVADRSRWGTSAQYPMVRRISIASVCPVCGGPRGEPVAYRFHEDGDWFTVDRWENRCGHVDPYEHVLAEAAELEAADRRPVRNSSITERTLDWTDLAAEAERRFGPNRALWTFECPGCGDLANGLDYENAGARAAALGIECLGRFVPGRGCDRSACGPVVGPWVVVFSTGEMTPAFPLAACAGDQPGGG